jgi:hypothetical protein
MAGGKRFKFTGSLIKLVQNYTRTTGSITAATKANPCVLTSSAHGLVPGDVITIVSVVGMTELNGGTYICGTGTTGSSITLDNTDSTGYTTYASAGTWNSATFTNFCELTNYNRAGGASAEIDAETLCSTAKEFEIGLPDFGTTTVDFTFAPKTALMLALIAAYKAGTTSASTIVLPNLGGSMTQLGFIQSMSEQAGKGGVWTGSLVMRNTGPRYDF